jgi:tetratricopeptide (TPR) repeat protein
MRYFTRMKDGWGLATVAPLVLVWAALSLGCGCGVAWADTQQNPQVRHEIEAARRLKVVGRFDEAKEKFRSLYERYPDDEAVIRGYSETLLISKDWGDAEKLYLEVRGRSGKQFAYARELEQVHMLQSRYREAAGDCMDILTEDPSKLEWVRGELVRISGAADEGVDLVLDALSERSGAGPAQPLSKILAVEMLARAARPTEEMASLEALSEADEIDANHFYILAVQLESLGDVKGAMAALRLALTREGSVNAVASAAFKLSGFLTAAGRAEESRQILERLADRYPNSAVAFKAQLELASLEAKALGRPERALALYEELLSQKNLPVGREEVEEAIASCLLRMGRLAESRDKFATLAGQDSKFKPEASFMVGEVSFFMGEADSALSIYAALADAHPEWDVANDALERMFLIQEGTLSGGEALGLYATAELLSTIGRPDSAMTYLESIIETHADSPLVDDAMFTASELYLDLGDADRAMDLCRSVVERYPDGRLAPLAQERLGDIWWEEKGDGNRALEEYTKGLDLYPNSLIAPRVRDKVSRLRREVG